MNFTTYSQTRRMDALNSLDLTTSNTSKSDAFDQYKKASLFIIESFKHFKSKYGKCDICHGLSCGELRFTKFKGKVTVEPEDYERVGRTSFLDPEKAAYNVGREKGKEEGFDEGWEEAEKR
ncbi:hypothetical protein [Caldiplasma sukawensis]